MERAAGIAGLSRRELEIARAYAAGGSYREIAQRLFIAPSTVRTHLSVIYRKLEVSSKIELLRALEIAGAVAGCAIDGDGRRAWSPQPSVGLEHTESLAGLPEPAGPSIAVLAFDNLSDDPDQELIANGMTDDIITALSRFPHFLVIARNSTFAYKNKPVPIREIARELGVRYVLEGSLRRVGSRIRVNAQLIDALANSHIWAESYDRDITDIFVLLDDIAEEIVSAVGTEVYRDGMRRSVRASPTQLQAWETSMRALRHLTLFTPQDIAQAQVLYRSVLQGDPSNSMALRGLAVAISMPVWIGLAPFDPALLSEAAELALRAIDLDPRDANAHCALATVRAAAENFDAANDAAGTACALNRNLALAAFLYGSTLAFLGRRDDAIAELDRGSRLSPHDPLVRIFVPCWRGLAEFVSGDLAAAAAHFDAASLSYPWPNLHVLRLAVAGLRGDGATTDAALEVLKRHIPQPSVRSAAGMFRFHRQADSDRLVEGLRKAGLPE